MGTKNNTGAFDCYREAEPDEPMFVLLGRDSTASIVVTFWRALKLKMVQLGTSKSSKEKLEEAHDCAIALEAWAKKIGKEPNEALVAMKAVLASGPGKLTGDTQEEILFHLRAVAEILMGKPHDHSQIQDMVNQQRTTELNDRQSDFVCSMLYASAEVLHDDEGGL